MDFFQSILLGIIQGVTEWLPISSSGHLVIIQEFFNINAPVGFDLLLHIGTLLVIIAFFRTHIYKIAKAFFKRDFSSEEGKWSLYIIYASLPIFFFGLFFESVIDSFFSSALVAGIGLIFTGIILYLTRHKTNNSPIDKDSAIKIGLFQAISLIPGVSRSGATIGGGILSGVERYEAARFSFLLSIPALAGAFFLKIDEFSFSIPYLAGFLTSIIVGFFSLKALMRIVRQGDLDKFAYYCILLGFIVISAFFGK